MKVLSNTVLFAVSVSVLFLDARYFCHCLPTRQEAISYELTRLKSLIQASIVKSKGTPIMPIAEWRSDWCSPIPFNQTIAHKNCEPVVIENNYCYGQCNSIYIPGGASPMQNCMQCSPKSYTWEKVELDCPQSPHHPKRIKSVQKIFSCSCRQC